MKRTREIPFSFNAESFKAAVAELEDSIKTKNGSLREVKLGKAGDFDVGLIVVDEDI